MGFNKSFADREPETQPSLSSAALFERIENYWQRFPLNSHPGVCNLDAQLSIRIVGGRNRDLPVRRRELHRVVDQIPKDLLQSRRVCTHMNSFRTEIEGGPQMFSIDFGPTDFEGVLQQGMRINDFEVELHLAAIDTR